METYIMGFINKIPVFFINLYFKIKIFLSNPFLSKNISIRIMEDKDCLPIELFASKYIKTFGYLKNENNKFKICQFLTEMKSISYSKFKNLISDSKNYASTVLQMDDESIEWRISGAIAHYISVISDINDFLDNKKNKLTIDIFDDTNFKELKNTIYVQKMNWKEDYWD
jgi:hypothetical protein